MGKKPSRPHMWEEDAAGAEGTVDPNAVLDDRPFFDISLDMLCIAGTDTSKRSIPPFTMCWDTRKKNC